MTGHPNRLFNRAGDDSVTRSRPFDHDDLDTEAPRRCDLSVGFSSTAVLGKNRIDVVCPEKRVFVFLAKGSAGEKVVGIGNIERRVDRLDAAHQIGMLRSRTETVRLLSADGKEDAARQHSKSSDRLLDGDDARPAISLLPAPLRSLQNEERRPGHFRRMHGVSGNAGGKGVGGVDQQIDCFFGEIAGKAFGASEPARAHRYGLGRGVRRSAGQRKRDIKIGAHAECGRQFAGLRRAAEDQDTVSVHV